MKPTKEDIEGLKAKATVMLDDARDQAEDIENPARRMARFKRAESVSWKDRCFHFNPQIKVWNAQGVTNSSQRPIFTAENAYCTCHDFHFGNKICKHLIALAGAVLKYENK